MGSKSTSGSAQKWAKPFAIAGANEAQSVYGANKSGLQGITDNITSMLPGLTDRFQQGDPNVNAARGYNSDVLGGKYLSGNPYLQQIIDQTNSDVGNRVNAMIGSRGGAGGSAQAQLLARELAKNEGNLRYSDYNTQQSRMDSAAAQAPAFNASDNSNLAALLQAAGLGAELPYTGINALTGSLGQLFNGGVQKQSSLGGILQGIGSIGSAAASF